MSPSCYVGSVPQRGPTRACRSFFFNHFGPPPTAANACPFAPPHASRVAPPSSEQARKARVAAERADRAACLQEALAGRLPELAWMPKPALQVIFGAGALLSCHVALRETGRDCGYLPGLAWTPTAGLQVRGRALLGGRGVFFACPIGQVVCRQGL